MTDKPPLGPDPRTDVVLDAKGLRALAHPVRVQLVWLLRKYGPSTATRLAERMGLTSGATSYHLRQLGTAGFVEEDAERGNARERWWRSVHRGTWLTDMDLVDQEPDATLTYLRSVAAMHALQAQQTLNGFPTLPRAWRDLVDLSDWSLRLTPGEAENLLEDMSAVIARYQRDRPEEATTAPEGAEHVTLIINLLPEPGLSPVRAGLGAGKETSGEAGRPPGATEEP